MAWVAVLLSGAIGCGSSTQLDDFADGGDAGRPRRDGGPRDAGVIDDAGFEDAGTLEPCARDLDCSGGSVCVANDRVAPMDLAPLPLACAPRRGGGSPQSACETADGCDRRICVLAGTCVAACVSDADCDPGQRCADVWAVTAPSVSQSLRGCVAIAAAPPGVTVTRERVPGAIRPGMTQIRLAPHEGTALYVLEPVSPAMAFVDRLDTAGATPVNLFDLYAIDGSSPAPLNPVSPWMPVTVLVPNSPVSIAGELGYDARITADGASDLVLSTVSRIDRGSILDVDVYYVGGGSLMPAGRELSPAVAAALAQVADALAPAGVRLGETRQHVVGGGLRRRYQIIEMDIEGRHPALGELFALSAGALRPSLNVFLVRTIDGALGIAGNIPGPHALHGTTGSGIAIAVDSLGAGGLPVGIDLGRVITHEGGHFLGLFHTTEVNGFVIEPLPDTAECRAERDSNGDGYLMPEECSGAGDDNVMFWAASGSGLSPQQLEVIGRALLLR